MESYKKGITGSISRKKEKNGFIHGFAGSEAGRRRSSGSRTATIGFGLYYCSYYRYYSSVDENVGYSVPKP